MSEITIFYERSSVGGLENSLFQHHPLIQVLDSPRQIGKLLKCGGFLLAMQEKAIMLINLSLWGTHNSQSWKAFVFEDTFR
ncbi:MAG: hypothetical protein HQM08_30080 [Candidatus Riflebacteria bacterium]|nr:hypothetical protein [Candidatus Riflebacteria bacterium]